MRTIKFRGKTFVGEWVNGDGYFSDETKKIIARNCRNFGEADITSYFEIIPETFGQFTGLFDKNGVEIYEGDIIKVDIFSKPYFISFGKSEKWGACFCVQSHNSITFLTKNWSSTSEVIGNIHENPELIHGVPELL